jgi:prefoldin subunit 5
MIPFNSVCYLEALIPKQETCIISLEADYAAEVSLTAAD